MLLITCPDLDFHIDIQAKKEKSGPGEDGDKLDNTGKLSRQENSFLA